MAMLKRFGLFGLLAAMLLSLVLPCLGGVAAQAATGETLPAESSVPQESVLPAESPAPEESVLPAESPAPEESVLPTESPAPQESVLPAESPVPEETAVPEDGLPAPVTDATPAPVEDDWVTETVSLEDRQSSDVSAYAASSPVSSAVYQRAAARIYAAAQNLETRVDLYDLNITYVSGDLQCPMCHVYFGAQEDRPDIFWLADSYSVNYSSSTGRVNYITLTYITSTSSIPSMRTKYEAKIQSVLNSIPSRYSTDLEKALYLHDWLILNNFYATGSSFSQITHSGYSALCVGETVCSGYARAYKDMLTRLGIPCRYVRSDSLNHAWNMVQIGGVWFEVDVTWDDASVLSYGPDYDQYNYVGHSFFLIPTSTMESLHDGGRDAYSYNPAALPSCTSSRYASYAFRYVTASAMYKSGGRWYYINDAGDFVSSNLDGSGRSVIYSSSGSPVYGYFANGRLYFSEGRSLRSINLDGSGLTLYYTYPSSWRILEFYVTSDRFYIGALNGSSYQLQYHLLSNILEGNPGTVTPEPNDPGGTNGWVASNGRWYYYKDGKLQTGWLKDGAYWYYLDPSTGVMATGWRTVDGVRYYLKPSGPAGSMAVGWQKIDGLWYYFAGSGASYQGWVKDGVLWYYIQNGKMLTSSWLKEGSTWYWLDSAGIMAVGWRQIGGVWYYFAGSGAMRTGWVQTGGKWYYLDGSGVMRTGWVQTGGKWYYLDGSGAMRTGWVTVDGARYYLDGSGAMCTGWVTVDGMLYYLDDSGAMARSGWYMIDGRMYYFDANGVCLLIGGSFAS